MKTLNFPDRLNPVFVKELRQSIHDKTLPYMALAVVAAQLLAGYAVWASGDAPGRPFFTGSLSVFFGLLLVLRMIWAQRVGGERDREGFDPLAGTGYPVRRAVFGRLAAETCMIAVIALLALPWFVWGGMLNALPKGFAAGVPIGACWLFAAGESFHYIAGISVRRKFPGLVLFAAFCWGIGILLLAVEGADAHFRALEICGFLLLAGLTMICGQIQNRMPVRSDRSAGFKAMLLATALYLVCLGIPPEIPLFGAGWLLMFGSLFERREPSRRQIEGAPRNAVLRFFALFFSSGVLPGFLLSSTLFAASAAFGKTASPAPTLLAIAYLQTALFAVCKWRVSPFAAWLVIAAAANLPVISGNLLPWAAALSADAAKFIGDPAATVCAAAACALSVLLNAKPYTDFARRYFEPCHASCDRYPKERKEEK